MNMKAPRREWMKTFATYIIVHVQSVFEYYVILDRCSYLEKRSVNYNS